MPRRLKVYVTSIGFFDLAIAAPSMKAALAAWGAHSNLFHQNFAKEVHDADIAKLAMQHPGIVLKRPVGSTKPFAETSELPDDLISADSRSKSTRKPRPNQPGARKTSATDAKKASAAYEREERKRRDNDRREEAKRAEVLRKRAAAVAEAEARLESAQTDHEGKLAEFAASRDELDRGERDESRRWEAEKWKLEAAVKKARMS